MTEVIDFKASKPDPRVWLFLIIIVSLLTFLCGSRLELFVLFIFLSAVMAWQKMTAAALAFSAAYAVLLVLIEFFRFLPVQSVSMVFSMLILLIFRLIPVYMAYVILLERAPLNELMTALGQMHIPKMLIIPLAVVYRYIPTLQGEIKYIRDSMTMRGLNVSFAGMALHPGRTVEMMMIPLLIRSAKLADELSAAALCKGLDERCARTSFSEVRFEKSDAVCCSVWAMIAALFVLFHYLPFR
ncbi:energy-coupling factor transporter transmembrane protein EcfT|uniref:Energy-coupling factor transport system permease protein n=2 Tax=Dendrosporobacter quercicolus TaxID=146817 RepID=A0A1G9RU72_9FIRM|nr:energy-coupling factor transporter transmembrane protein EcfT [Dendrosporobacter quercicolus DSM 1736]SDM26045.1 energy-coupling factor transport system permease protein [Dendrosporobacter quercicolus]